MEQESSVSRSSQLAYDWITLGRTTSRQEVLHEIEQLTAENLIEHFSEYPPKRWTLVTIGPEPLEFHDAV
jgi:predicted Zn-dependent peptidase